MGKQNRGKQGGGAKVPVIKSNTKNAEPEMIEKRMDVSDGNGPFTFASFVRFHGEEKGAELWEMGADSAVVEPKKQKGAGKSKPMKQAAGQPAKGNKAAAANISTKTTNTKAEQAENLRKKAEELLKKAAALEGGKAKQQDAKKAKKGKSKGGNKGDKQEGGSKTPKGGKGGAAGAGSTKVAKEEKSKKGKGKGGAEKRIDPSDGNGPFTKASFIKFHGEKKGMELWNTAA